LVGAGGIYAVWFWHGSKDKDKPKPIAAKARRSKGRGKGVLTIFFAIFALVGAGMLYPLLIRPIAKTLDARNWPETPCKILSAKVGSHSSDDGTTYSIDIFYEYEFQGGQYKSSRYGFIGGSSSGSSGKAKVVNSYRKAKNPVCYVNPKNPAEAVLKRGFHAGLLIGLIPIPFFAIGAGGLIHTFRSKKRRRKSTIDQWLPDTGTTSTFESQLATGWDSAPIILKPKYSPLTKLLGAIAVAAFWNGIVSIFVVGTIRDFQRGHSDWFGAVFMIPFVLIGLAIIGYVVYQFLALFNPRPTLRLGPGTIPLGGAAELQWSFSGRTSVISRLKITLQAREEATYRRGTKTHTDKNTFFDLEIIETRQRNEIASGQVGLIIPADTMHSFEARNNKIIWTINVHGDIAKWPDVKESFKITVAPAEPID